MVQDTCQKEKCPYWKLTGNDDRPCPMYVGVTYQPPPTNPGQPHLVHDCAPVRSLLLLQELSNRLVGVERAQEEQRNEAAWVQVVAEVLGKNSGVNLEFFVAERKRLSNIAELKGISS